MNLLHPLPVSVKFHVLVVLVATLGSGVRGHPCPKGQVAHQDVGEMKCCLPVYCEPNHHVQYCKENGTSDTCASCGDDHWLLKRTSSFDPEQCLRRRLSPQNCVPVPGPGLSSKEENGSCHCDPEKGQYYLKPEIPIIFSSNCQPFGKECQKGFEPTVEGSCEPCPANTFQDENKFKLCRHQRNCTALGLATEELGNASKEAVCAKPPPPPPVPGKPSLGTTTGRPAPSPNTTTPSTPGVTDIGTVGPVKTRDGGTDPYVIVIPLVCTVLLLTLLGGLLFFARRRRWIRGIACLDGENPPCHTGDYPMASADNDNTSDNSCCACADSCIASSSKSNSNGACGKSGASASGDVKQPLPMLEGFMNGKCGKESPGDGSMSEPLYSSIPPGGKLGNGDVASYVNGGIRPTRQLRQEDFYNYPNKVHIPSSDDDDDENNAVNKERQAKRQQAAGKRREEDEAFTETDPLLPNAENASSGAPTPDVAYPLRGILRNGNNNRQEPRGRGGGGGAVGNRPNLSMLLSEEPSYSSGEGGNVDNLPHLSQLVSRSTRSDPSSLPEEPPEQHVHELPQQLVQHLQQQQQQHQQQLQQEAPTLAARLPPTVPVMTAAHPRLNPATQPHLNPSPVQMEELKPVMPLHPSSPVTSPSPPAPPAGAANVTDSKGRSGSPARIDPTKQEEVRGRDPVSKKTVDPGGKATTTATTASKVAGREKERDEQTYRKQALPSSSPDSHDDEETAHKSVGGSSGLGESLDVSLLSDEGRRSRGNYRRSQSEVSRSVSPSQPLPRSISSPEEKHRPFAVVKPMQSDQSLNISNDQLPAIAQQQLDNTRCNYPLNSLHTHTRRQVSQDSSDDPDLTRPKTPDRLSEDENEENETGDNSAQDGSEDRTRTRLFGNNDSEPTEDSEEGSGGKDKPTDGGSEG